MHRFYVFKILCHLVFNYNNHNNYGSFQTSCFFSSFFFSAVSLSFDLFVCLFFFCLFCFVAISNSFIQIDRKPFINSSMSLKYTLADCIISNARGTWSISHYSRHQSVNPFLSCSSHFCICCYHFVLNFLHVLNLGHILALNLGSLTNGSRRPT